MGSMMGLWRCAHLGHVSRGRRGSRHERWWHERLEQDSSLFADGEDAHILRLDCNERVRVGDEDLEAVPPVEELLDAAELPVELGALLEPVYLAAEFEGAHDLCETEAQGNER